MATVDPVGPRGAPGREHMIKIVLELGGTDAEQLDRDHVVARARRVLDACETRDVLASRRGKAGAVTTSVVAVEGHAVVSGRPGDAAIESLRAALLADGYRVSVRERRECSEPVCSTDALVAWNDAEHVPIGWFSSATCGRHSLRRCAGCASVYRLSSTNAAGQAPSVHCEVCGMVLVEWGGSKIWTAQLISRGRAP
jgi:hypothetical protein